MMKEQIATRLDHLLDFLKNHYKNRAWNDTNFAKALINHHAEDFFLELNEEQIEMLITLLKK